MHSASWITSLANHVRVYRLLPGSDKDEKHGDPDETYEFFEQLDAAQMHIWQGSKHHTGTEKAPEFVDVVSWFVTH